MGDEREPPAPVIKPPDRSYHPEWERQGYASDDEMQEAFTRKWVSLNRAWIAEHGDSGAKELLRKYGA